MVVRFLKCLCNWNPAFFTAENLYKRFETNRYMETLLRSCLIMSVSLKDSISRCNINNRNNSSVIKQKGESQNGCYKKIKHTKFHKNEHFLPPDTHAHTHSTPPTLLTLAHHINKNCINGLGETLSYDGLWQIGFST